MSIIQTADSIVYAPLPLDEYHTHRLKTGLAEGIEEVPTASCFPLEYNLDLLHGGM